MSHLQYVDELVKDYLLYRGFSQTLRTLDNELKLDKDRGFKVERIIEQITSSIQTYDLTGLLDLWKHLERRIFVRLPLSLQSCIKKFETSILRLYVINTIQTHKLEKLTEFFDRMASDLLDHSEWKEWFALPYLRSVEDNPTFAMFFTKQWQDTLYISLQNFLAVVFQNLELPTLARYYEESAKVNRLTEEVEGLSLRLSVLTSDDTPPQPPTTPPPRQAMDDFYNIAQETPTYENQMKSLKTILFNLGGSSPTTTKPTGATVPSSQQSRQRTPSLTPSSDRRRGRSSSLAPSSSRGNDGSLKRVPSVTRRSRSPTKTTGTSPAQSKPSFQLIGQDEYMEHKGVVSHTVYNPSGTMIASADIEGVVKIWSPSPALKTQCTVMMKNAVTAVEWFPNTERLLLLTTKSGNVKLYDTKEKKAVFDLSGDNCPLLKDQRMMGVKVTPAESSAVLSVYSRGRQSASSSSSSGSIYTLDVKTMAVESSHTFPSSIVNGCCLIHNGCLLVCGCNDGTVKIVDRRCADVISSWVAHQGEVFTVRLSAHEDVIYTIGSDNRFACWSMTQTGAKVFDYGLHDRAAGPFMVPSTSSGHQGRSVLLWPYAPLFALHSDGRHVFTCSTSGSTVYKIKDSSLEDDMILETQQGPVVTLDLSTNQQLGTCVTASLDGKVSVSTITPS